jgi:hypothetical protein
VTYDDTKCWQCGLPRYSFIGPEKRPDAVFCFDHDAKFIRSNKARRGDILNFLRGWRYGVKKKKVA